MDIHLVSTDKKTFLVVTLSVKSGEGGCGGTKKNILFRSTKHDMSSKIAGWLVGVRDGKIPDFRIKSGIIKKIPE